MNSKYATRGVIFIHSVPPAVRPHVEWAVSSVLGYEVQFEWTRQPALPSMYRAETSWTGEVGMGAVLASAMGGWEHLRFEITEDPTPVSEGGRWSCTPGLGIFYAQTDLTGNVVVHENRIRAAIEQAGGNAKELQRLLDLALGQAWDDELEPFRYAGAGAPVRWLHRVG
ncbi:MAG: DUF3145 domain-containing protein [Ancrocorticia sp.]|jgi:hypothetical protein|nr:DUF3145 domain-containing protein [Ancrocorticia sp.]MCI1963144.1 DUF3145 domain-containing protein [Ancrocorticia sp.]MCI2001512.1 DUF3145 domain-containing protein [Ancrocorticia sp.]MCI2030032.1 DUF3145 domain-containing protein [Ancrocorticia sp.]MCI2178655.1 DUF3145 domain-containing protein [Ancrocorticia sp.]